MPTKIKPKFTASVGVQASCSCGWDAGGHWSVSPNGQTRKEATRNARIEWESHVKSGACPLNPPQKIVPDYP